MKNRLIPYLVLLILLVIFTFTYGVVYYPTLDADNAIHIIMLDNLRLPEDLYYMGQDRLGSVIPLIAWPLYKLGVSGIWAITLSQLIIFGLSGLILIRLFSNRLLACLALVLMLFPLSVFYPQVLSGQPYPGHILILFLAIAAFKKWGLKNPVVLLFAGMGLWASGIFAANIAAAGLIYLFSRSIHLAKKKYWLRLLKALLWALPGVALLIVAKNTATTTDTNYTQSSFTDASQFGDNLVLFGRQLWDFLSFNHVDFWMCAALWMLIILIGISLAALFKKPLVSWSWFFVLSGFISVLAVLLSEWAFRMGLPLRYYSIGYLQILWGLMLSWDSTSVKSQYQKPVITLFALAALISVCSGLLAEGRFGSQTPGKLYADTTRRLAEEIDTRGILGSYWYVYLIEGFKPDQIISLVHQNEINRDFDAMKAFLKLDTITVIRNSFVDELKPVIYDHGIYYHKVGPVKKVDHVEYAKYYKPRNFPDTYHLNEMRINFGEMTLDSTGTEVLHISPESVTGTNLAFYGPYVTLDAGTYEICFDLTFSGELGPHSFLAIQKRMAQVKKWPIELLSDNPCLEFTLDEPAVDVEFRMDYFQQGEIELKAIHLKKLSN